LIARKKVDFQISRDVILWNFDSYLVARIISRMAFIVFDIKLAILISLDISMWIRILLPFDNGS